MLAIWMTSRLTCASEPPGSVEVLPPLPLVPLCVAPSEVMTEVALLYAEPVEVAVLLRDMVELSALEALEVVPFTLLADDESELEKEGVQIELLEDEDGVLLEDHGVDDDDGGGGGGGVHVVDGGGGGGVQVLDGGGGGGFEEVDGSGFGSGCPAPYSHVS